MFCWSSRLFSGPSHRTIGCGLIAAAFSISACTSPTPSPIIVFDTNPDARPEPHTTFAGRTRIVKAGDNLYSIAFEAGFHTREVARWNNMNSDDPIYIGQEIKLYPPAGEEAAPSVPTAAETSPSSATAAESTYVAPSNSSASPTDWIWPTRGRIISGFSTGERRNGISIAGETGTPISAAADGRVVYAGTGLIGFGRIIIVKHSEQFISVYAHNSRLVVNEGDNVTQGQKIAEMGQTDADRVKLHFEIRRNGKPVNPLQLLPKG